jgi:dipeptidyl aminopeptidase/acylaminoacyl peptidase
LLVIGGSDKRVVPHQSVQYYHALKSMGVKTKMYYYPEDGHAVPGSETGTDAEINILLWLDEHLKNQD